MNPGLRSAPGVASRTIFTLVALAPVLVVESLARGAVWTTAWLSALVVAMGLAGLAKRIRGENRAPFPADLALAVTASLIALLLPVDTGWTTTCLAVAVAVVVGRQAFGGPGQALFNPAMVGLALVGFFLARPGEAAAWSAWATSALWLGGFLLLLRRVVAWCTVLAFFAGAVSAAAWLPPPGLSSSMAAVAALSHPAWLLCAFFIAADSSTGCLHARARLGFGLGCGLLVVAFEARQPLLGLPMAMLLMNAAAPWLDQMLARPRQKVPAP